MNLHLERLLGPDLVAAIEELVDERVEQRLALLSLPTGEGTWLTLEHAATRLGCSPDAVRMRIKRGRLAARHDGRRVYVSRASVDGVDR